MRSTDIRSVPSSGSTPIDFFIGQQGVGAIVVHNASYRVLALSLSNGIAVNIAAQRSDLVVIGQATFDGHVTLTPGLLLSAQTNAGSVWLDVYLPGERVAGTYPAPCGNGMTAGNQQPRPVVVPIAAFFNSFAVKGVNSASGDQRLFIQNMSYPTSGSAVSYFFSFDISYQCTSAVSTDLFSIQVTLQIQPLDGTSAPVGPPIQVRAWYVSFAGSGGPPIPFAWPNPLAIPVGNVGGAAATYSIEALLHFSAGPAGKTVNFLLSLQHDQDRQHLANIPAQGGGFGGGSGFPGQEQYTGTVF